MGSLALFTPPRDEAGREKWQQHQNYAGHILSEEWQKQPNGLAGTPSFCKAHVNLQLIKSRSPTRRNLLHRLWWGLKETGAKLGTGRKVANRNDAVVWLIEQLEEPV